MSTAIWLDYQQPMKSVAAPNLIQNAKERVAEFVLLSSVSLPDGGVHKPFYHGFFCCVCIAEKLLVKPNQPVYARMSTSEASLLQQPFKAFCRSNRGHMKCVAWSNRFARRIDRQKIEQR